ncbi:MAG: SRPBCC family protein [Sphingobacteriaceae bacterium]|jgi:effector-binding domain-containing protein
MKKVVYVLVGLVLLYLILCFVGPKEVTVERSTEIKISSVEDMQHKMADLKFFHDKWSPWTRLDPNMKTSYAGECCKPGSSYSWESDKDSVGKGSMTFNEFKGDSVLITLHFDGMGDSKVYYITKPSANGMNVTWGMLTRIGFFGRAPMLFMNMDKMIGPDFEKGLAMLKKEVESMPAETAAKYDIQEIDWAEHFYIGVKSTLKFPELPKFFGESYGKIGAFMAKNKLEMACAPSAIYFTYDDVKMETECAAVMCLKEKKETKELETYVIPAGKALLIPYYGAYDKSANAHYAMDAYMKEKGLMQTMVIEEYVTDPMSEKDTAKWLTNIYYILK